jgi:MinD superfamily P-loop ATPase
MATDVGTEAGRTGAVLMDGSPGTGCPVIASITGARYAVVVTEPTVSGLHDLERILDLTKHFHVATGVIVNKADLNPDMTSRIEAVATEWGVQVLGTLPYESKFTEAQIEGKSLLEYAECATGAQIQSIWWRVCHGLSPAHASPVS